MKLDEPFPNGKFNVPGYALSFCLDRNQFGGSIMVFIREDIPSRFISSNQSTKAQEKNSFFVLPIILTETTF